MVVNWCFLFLFTGPASKTSESTGVIREVITQPGELTGRNVEATPENPRYEVRTYLTITSTSTPINYFSSFF